MRQPKRLTSRQITAYLAALDTLTNSPKKDVEAVTAKVKISKRTPVTNLKRQNPKPSAN